MLTRFPYSPIRCHRTLQYTLNIVCHLGGYTYLDLIEHSDPGCKKSSHRKKKRRENFRPCDLLYGFALKIHRVEVFHLNCRGLSCSGKRWIWITDNRIVYRRDIEADECVFTSLSPHRLVPDRPHILPRRESVSSSVTISAWQEAAELQQVSQTSANCSR